MVITLQPIYNKLSTYITSYDRNTTQHVDYEIEFSQTSTRYNSIAHVGPKLWNNIILKHRIIFLF